jgi:class 3 adenylate cyclase
MTTAAPTCQSCGAALNVAAKFCSECGKPASAGAPAEYKQVTVLFADVVRSMDIAAALGPERLREVMTELFSRSSAVVQRYGGTVDKFTGDGIMAVFGAPVALEDHALRACLAALDLQRDAVALASDVQSRDGLEFRLRVGLNSGQVIAGQIGSDPSGYTSIGEQVGMAQRMESVAPPGGVMLSELTARLVEDATVLGEPETVHVKGADAPVAARRLLEMRPMPDVARQGDLPLVGRRWELVAVEGILERVAEGHGGVIGVVGPAGIGKSRITRELAAMAVLRKFEVFSAFCESHTSDIAFHVAARLLRAASRAGDLDDKSARDQIRSEVLEADEQDLVLFYDLIGIRDPATPLPAIDADARSRRLTTFIKSAALAREQPAVYIVEDAHWIDKVSESMIADLLTVIPQTRSMVLITYRPEYRGTLARVPEAQTIALAPLGDSDSSALVAELLGRDSSVEELASTIIQRASGNPFFVQEIVRDLMERNVLQGNRGAYTFSADAAAVSVPATLQATIAARIDRLDAPVKRALCTAAVIGSRFGADLLARLGIDAPLDELVAADLIDQVKFTSCAEYVFHHPLIRTVAYESLLRSDRAELHRRVAASIEQDVASLDKNAALIAEHLEAACEFKAAYPWHMRAASVSNAREPVAARSSWQHARHVADQVAPDDPERLAMRIEPRVHLCSTAWRVWGSVAETRFDELNELCSEANDLVSKAIALSGLVTTLVFQDRFRDAAQYGTELAAIVESIGASRRSARGIAVGADDDRRSGGRLS